MSLTKKWPVGQIVLNELVTNRRKTRFFLKVDRGEGIRTQKEKSCICTQCSPYMLFFVPSIYSSRKCLLSGNTGFNSHNVRSYIRLDLLIMVWKWEKEQTEVKFRQILKAVRAMKLHNLSIRQATLEFNMNYCTLNRYYELYLHHVCTDLYIYLYRYIFRNMWSFELYICPDRYK